MQTKRTLRFIAVSLPSTSLRGAPNACPRLAALSSFCSQRRYQFTKFLHRGLIDAVAHARPVDLPANPACFFEYFQVLRHGALSQRQPIHDLPADATFTALQKANNRRACRVPQSLGKLREGRVLRIRQPWRINVGAALFFHRLSTISDGCQAVNRRKQSDLITIECTNGCCLRAIAARQRGRGGNLFLSAA